LESLVSQKRAGQLSAPLHFWLAAERVPMLQTVYPDAVVQPRLLAPDSELKKDWERAEAIRELVRGRMEISGPLSVQELADFLHVPNSEIETAMAALEAEGFVLRGKFRPGAPTIEWCDRRLLARIHRLTINRLRSEIQPVSLADFQRFLALWQRLDAEHQVEGPEGLRATIELLDGYELPAGAWEPEVLARRVKDYDPHWLDQICFTGRIGWGRLSPRQNQNGRPSTPIRSSPVSIYLREHLSAWHGLSMVSPMVADFAPDTRRVFETLAGSGALFFGEIVKHTGLLPSRVEQALSELSAQGWVTSDSFEGLRALLMPQEKRMPFADTERKRRHKAVTSLEFAGRWSLLRRPGTHGAPAPLSPEREAAVEIFARVLLRRYGVMFRRLLERESFNVSWYELGRVYRRLEARGGIRGGYFVGGVSGEQFALPEAIGALRSLRKTSAKGELIPISGADPLNLCGILTPGPRITAIASNQILLRDGVPIAAFEAGRPINLELPERALDRAVENRLRVGSMPPTLRPYYA
jgi:ATP-dependent Lhr-like helicase